MERESNNFSIYKITSPTGGIYIGATKASLKERLNNHLNRAKKHPEHPFYQTILKFDRKGFEIELIETCNSKEEANVLETKYIAQYGLDFLYNYSPGGDKDSETATKVFWERLNKNPEARKVYIDKLRMAQSNQPEGRFDSFAAAGTKWRLENPREAYKIRSRATRCATKINTTNGINKKIREDRDSRPLKEKLLEKHKNIFIKKKEAVKKIWELRTENEKSNISLKISNTLKNKYIEESGFKDLNVAQLGSARDKIDRVKQAKAASEGLKKYWEDLKKDTFRYEALLTARKETARLKRELKKEQDVK